MTARRNLMLLLAFAGAFQLSGCGDDDDDIVAGGGPPPVVEPPKEKPFLASLDRDEVLAQAAEAADGAASGRLAGPTRYATAARIAEELPDTDTVYLAVGTNYPDTLAGGPATDGSPILLTGTEALPQETAEALATRSPNTVIALGGPVAIADEVLAAAADAAGGAATDRLEGETRYGTGVAIADTVADDPGFAGTVFVAVGTNYPDAVSAASAGSARITSSTSRSATTSSKSSGDRITWSPHA